MKNVTAGVINESVVTKLIDTVNAGLCHGLGVAEPGKMCVEAAVCYALGMEHGDRPACVSPAIRAVKIALNDSAWSSNAARANGMLKIAVLQLGTDENFDDLDFVRRMSEMTIGEVVPRALRHAAEVHPDPVHKQALEDAAIKCEKDKNGTAAATCAIKRM